MDDEAVLALVTRLARPHGSGGQVIERAAIMAAGADSAAVIEWVLAHAGEPEEPIAASRSRGLHGARLSGGAAESGAPSRFVLPPGVLPGAAQDRRPLDKSRRNAWDPSTR
jgi:hypothetical protein